MSDERYVIDGDAPGPCRARAREPERHYGVRDRRHGYAVLPDATLCWRMTYDRALDALLELRQRPAGLTFNDEPTPTKG